MSGAKKLVHITHHSCIAHGLGIDGLFARLYDEGEKPYGKNRYEQAYGSSARHPAAFGDCRYSSRTSLLSTNLDDVTCASCRTSVENDSRERLLDRALTAFPHDRRYYERRAEAWCDEKELQIRAWIVCCRHAGAPFPGTRREMIKRLRDARASYIVASVRVATFVWPGDIGCAGRLKNALEKLEPDDRELMRGALQRARKADALMKKAHAITQSIEATAAHAAKRIRSSAVVRLRAGAV